MSGMRLDYDIPEWNGYRGPGYEEAVSRLIETLEQSCGSVPNMYTNYVLHRPFLAVLVPQSFCMGGFLAVLCTSRIMSEVQKR